MSVTLRLTKVGKRGERKFRIVAKETRSKNRGKAIDIIGFIDKINKVQNIDKEKVSYWKKNGAIITTALQKYLV